MAISFPQRCKFAVRTMQWSSLLLGMVIAAWPWGLEWILVPRLSYDTVASKQIDYRITNWVNTEQVEQDWLRKLNANPPSLFTLAPQIPLPCTQGITYLRQLQERVQQILSTNGLSQIDLSNASTNQLSQAIKELQLLTRNLSQAGSWLPVLTLAILQTRAENYDGARRLLDSYATSQHEEIRRNFNQESSRRGMIYIVYLRGILRLQQRDYSSDTIQILELAKTLYERFYGWNVNEVRDVNSVIIPPGCSPVIQGLPITALYTNLIIGYTFTTIAISPNAIARVSAIIDTMPKQSLSQLQFLHSRRAYSLLQQSQPVPGELLSQLSADEQSIATALNSARNARAQYQTALIKNKGYTYLPISNKLGNMEPEWLRGVRSDLAVHLANQATSQATSDDELKCKKINTAIATFRYPDDVSIPALPLWCENQPTLLSILPTTPWDTEIAYVGVAALIMLLGLWLASLYAQRCAVFGTLYKPLNNKINTIVPTLKRGNAARDAPASRLFNNSQR